MGSQSRKLKRQQQQALEFKFREKTTNPANRAPQPVSQAEAYPQMNQSASIETITQNAFMQGLTKGMSSSFLFAIDSLQVTLEQTKGVGQKLTTAINHTFHENLHRKELFDNFMSEEPKGEVFIVSKEEQEFIKLLREVENIVYNKKENKLTIKELLSILNFEETTHEELTSIINRLKGVN